MNAVSRGERRSRFVLLGLILLGVVVVIGSLGTGSVSLSLKDLWNGFSGEGERLGAALLWDLRLPRAVAALATGGLLALAGTLLQVVLRNPLADPYVLGVSGGAACAVLGGLLLGLRGSWGPGVAFGGALFSIFLVA
ncbi:MAG: iron chelate uptake ABC transporter family permease subunit, partial [Magnetococcales bacterium]|nr:iron chelate uptake ABC transporter family permease subunit [Magnetococcales bacterium]